MTEAGVAGRKPKASVDMLGYLIGGFVALVTGIAVILPSLIGYMDALDARRSLNEKAEELGLDEIPGVNLDSTARLFLVVLTFGGVLTAAGLVFITVAVMGKRTRKES